MLGVEFFIDVLSVLMLSPTFSNIMPSGIMSCVAMINASILSVTTLNVIILSGVMLNIIILSITKLSVIILNFVMLNVINDSECY
jgi:hypothetical protein